MTLSLTFDFVTINNAFAIRKRTSGIPISNGAGRLFWQCCDDLKIAITFSWFFLAVWQ